MKNNIKKVHLVLKHQWYDMIESGVKNEEYRENTPRYQKMLTGATHIVFHRGYTSITMERKISHITLGLGKPQLGAPSDREVLCIKLNK